MRKLDLSAFDETPKVNGLDLSAFGKPQQPSPVDDYSKHFERFKKPTKPEDFIKTEPTDDGVFRETPPLKPELPEMLTPEQLGALPKRETYGEELKTARKIGTLQTEMGHIKGQQIFEGIFTPESEKRFKRIKEELRLITP
ncbi:unnamed protein product, partial [marine sediment metagenome]